jgi:hypothetical protein
MPTFTPISSEKHANSKWRRFANYSFAASEGAAPIVAAEITKAVPVMPLVFIEQGGKFELSALLSVVPGQNMFVAPDGRWLSTFIPSSIRSYPFRLVTPQGSEQSILCIEEGCVVSADNPLPGEPLFGADGKVGPTIQQALDFLTSLERNRIVTALAVSSLAQAGIIKPWPITIKNDQGETRPVNGLNSIDEATLNALPNEDFIKLRATGALPIAYAQLLSMSQLGVFEHLARLQGQMAPKPVAPLPDSLDKLFDRSDNLEIRFD